MSDFPPTRIRISDDVKASIFGEFDRQEDLEGVVPDSDRRAYAEAGAKHLRNQLPAPVLEALTAWCREPAPWLTVTNLPRPPGHVPTPQDGFGDESVLTVANLVQFGMVELLGLLPVAYRWENEGRLIRNVAPRPDSGAAQTSWGSSAPLDWHTDDSVLDHHESAPAAFAVPHFLTFYGMRNEERVPTELLALDVVLRALPGAVVDALRQPEFNVTAPESYRPCEGGGPMRRAGVPLVWTLPGGQDAVRYGPGRVLPDTPRAAAALEGFERLLARLPGEPVLIGAGDFHLFDNRRVLHRRVTFRPAPLGAARWLRRCYARSR